ncbi:uncharacterized protein LOC123527491 [Mercenaria mercenaria]|uniref:uncharacterized protein LOC123527491 n=1 Tax=Mercenaria mercenaria TaxID=6596 RepID=UPI00234E71C6|nr:uncharacterized protein LOC123527491 [Mercenaria mercenaria]
MRCAVDDLQKQVEGRILEYRSQICRVFRAPSVLRWMPSFFSAADEREIITVDLRNPEKASFLFIDKILKCTHVGKWTAFLEALKRADYPYLVSLLKFYDQDQDQCYHQKKILQIFAPYLELQLEPCDLIMHLNASHLINMRDMEEIMACQRNQGSVAATILLLDRIQRRQAPSRWYTDFLKILYQKGFKDIVREMEPEFTLDCEILKLPNVIVTETKSDSAIEMDEIGNTVEEKIETKVKYFQTEITELVRVEKIAPALCQLIGIEKVCQLMHVSRNSQKESIGSMLEEIGKLKNKTKWRNFITCLKDSDYPHLADLLSRPRTSKLQCRERDLLRLFHSTLGEQLDPVDLITHLEKDNAINHRDKEEILSTVQQSGKTAASLVLIDCLQCRLAPTQWFRAFLNALVACDREDIVQTIHPDYLKSHMSQTDDTLKEECGNEDNSSADNELVNRIDTAHCHIYKLEKTAKLELDKIQQHFDDMKNSLCAQIENKTIAMSKTLEHVNTLAERESQEDISQEMEKCLQQVTTSCYTLCAAEPFMNLEKLGVLHEPKQTLHRQSSLAISTKGSDSLKNCPKPSHGKHRVVDARSRHYSGSSSSSSSSGYLIVEKSTSLSTSSITSIDERSQTKNASKVTFADSKESAQEIRDKKATKVDNSRLPSRLIQNKDYLALYSKRKISPGRRRTVSESSILSTDASIVSSTDRPSSSATDALYDTSITSSTTKTTSVSEKKVLVERTESYLYHHKMVISCNNNCLFSSLCVLPSNKTVLVDQGNGCFYIYDDASNKFISRRLNHHIPICVCNVGDSLLFILFRRRDCTNVLVQYFIHFSTNPSPRRFVTGISFVKEVQVSSKCHGQLCSVASNNDGVLAFCSNKHIHYISTDGNETKTVNCDVVENEWWPIYSIRDSGCEFAFMYEVYSCSVYCFCIFTGQMTWKVKLPHVEGMTLCGEGIYLSMNIDNKIEILSKSTGNHERIITEHVRRPFAVSSSPGQDTIIVTQYHPKGNKINRMIKYF